MKNTKTTMKWFFILAIFGVFVISSCKKKETEETPTPTNNNTTTNAFASSEDESFANNTGNDVGNMADEAVDGNLTSYKEGGILNHCVVVTHSRKDSTLPQPTDVDTVTLDFSAVDAGAEDCQSHDLKYRKGKVRVAFMGKYHFCSSIKIWTEGYEVSLDGTNWYKVEMSRTITNGSKFGDSVLVFNHQESGMITRPDGKTIQWSGSGTRTWKGYDTPFNRFDDTYTLFGTHSGTSAEGKSYQVYISSSAPLVKVVADCKHFISGIVAFTEEHTSATPKKFKVDFGYGSCVEAKGTFAGADGQFGTSDDAEKVILLR